MIVIITDPNGQEIELSTAKEQFTIGRSSSCDMQINSEHVSRVHLEVKHEEGQILIKDISKSNWVSYDGNPLSKEDFVQYFSFMELLLPGGISLSIKSGVLDEVEKMTTSIKPVSSTLSETKIARPLKKRSRKTIMNERESLKVEDDLLEEVKKKISARDIVLVIVALLLVFVGAYFLL